MHSNNTTNSLQFDKGCCFDMCHLLVYNLLYSLDKLFRNYMLDRLLNILNRFVLDRDNILMDMLLHIVKWFHWCKDMLMESKMYSQN